MPCPRGVSAPSGGAWSHGGGLLLGGTCSRRVPGPWEGVCSGGSAPGGVWRPPTEMASLRAVRILLECILV